MGRKLNVVIHGEKVLTFAVKVVFVNLSQWDISENSSL